MHVPVDGMARSAGFYRTRTEAGVDVVFVEYPPFYDRPVLYGDYEDNRLRFAFLARAALEYFRSRGERPSVFHAHDWQTGLVPVFLKAFYWDDPTLHRTPSVFTIHNVAYQGQFGMDTLGLLGLPWNLGSSYALEYHGSISYLKGGTVFAELVNTVSPTYALEIQGPEHGFGFDGVVRSRAGDVVGDPQRRRLRRVGPARGPAHRADLLAGRHGRQGRLQGRPAARVRPAGVPRPAARGRDVAPRLAEGLRHRGRSSWWDFLQRPLRMVVLGTGDHGVQEGLRHLQQRDPDRFSVRFAYDEAVAHKVMAGSDFFLMPSRSEPCGLTQMYALRYGTVPIVRATGGPGRHGGAVRRGEGDGDGLPVRHAGRHRARVGGGPGARRLEETQGVGSPRARGG